MSGGGEWQERAAGGAEAAGVEPQPGRRRPRLPAAGPPTIARVRRLRPLAEAECYARCYGSRRQNVQVVKLERRRPRSRLGVTGEQLRQQFEARLVSRDAS